MQRAKVQSYAYFHSNFTEWLSNASCRSSQIQITCHRFMSFCLLNIIRQINHKLDDERIHTCEPKYKWQVKKKNHRQRCGGGMKMTNTKQVVVTHTHSKKTLKLTRREECLASTVNKDKNICIRISFQISRYSSRACATLPHTFIAQKK